MKNHHLKIMKSCVTNIDTYQTLLRDAQDMSQKWCDEIIEKITDNQIEWEYQFKQLHNIVGEKALGLWIDYCLASKT